MYLCMYVCMHVCVCVYVCMYVPMYVYIYTYTYLCVLAYTLLFFVACVFSSNICVCVETYCIIFDELVNISRYSLPQRRYV